MTILLQVETIFPLTKSLIIHNSKLITHDIMSIEDLFLPSEFSHPEILIYL